MRGRVLAFCCFEPPAALKLVGHPLTSRGPVCVARLTRRESLKGDTLIEREDGMERPVDKGAPKRKGPIVNRRGPSEVSRAIQMMNTLNGRPASGKKPSHSGVGKGTILRIDRAKGYGFIVDSAGEQRFFHRTAVLDGGFDSLEEQLAVDFEPYTDERGARAQKVRPAGKPLRNEPAPRTSKPSPKASTAKTSTWKSDLSPFRSGSGTPSRKKFKI